MSLIDVVNNWLVFPLLGISEFHHAYRSSSAIETVKEFTLSRKINWVLVGPNIHNISFKNNSSELHD